MANEKEIDRAADALVAVHIADNLSLAITQLSDVFDAGLPNEQADYIPALARDLASRFTKIQIEHLLDVVNETLCIQDGE